VKQTQQIQGEEKKGTLQIRAYGRNMDLVVLKPRLGSTARVSRLGWTFAARDGIVMEEREEENKNGMHIRVSWRYQGS
jgi:hypothetical protein